MLLRAFPSRRRWAEVKMPWPFGLTVLVHHAAAYQFGYARERELQAVACARFVEDYLAGRNAHVILLGDFNDTPDSSSVRFGLADSPWRV